MNNKPNIQETGQNKMNRGLYTLLIILYIVIRSATPTAGQEYQYYSQYMFNGLAINPAYAGSQDLLTLTGNIREQWVGIKGAPSTQTISVHSPILHDQFGLGLILINDRVGVTSTQDLSLNYSYKLMLPKYSIAFGLKLGFNSLIFRFDQLAFIEEQDANFQNNNRVFLPLFGIGAYLKSTAYYVGLSVPHLYTFVHKNYENSNINLNKLILLTGGYIFTLNDDLKIKPSFLAKADFGSVFEMDLNANIYYKDDYCFGISYKSLNSLAFIFEIGLNKSYYLGYSYDLVTTRLLKHQAGTHEISLNIYLNGKNKTKIINPRYF